MNNPVVIAIFTIVYTFTAKSQFEKKSKLALNCRNSHNALNDICPQPSWAYGHSSKIKSRSLWVMAHWEQRQSFKNTIAEMPPGNELYSYNLSRILSGPRRPINTKQEVDLSKALLFMWTRGKIIVSYARSSRAVEFYWTQQWSKTIKR